MRLGPDLRQIAVASPDYLARHGTCRPAARASSSTIRCIRWRRPRTTPYHWEFWQDGDWFEVAVDGPMIVSDKAMALAAALDGIGIALRYSTIEVERHIAEGRLVPVPEAWSAPFPGLFLAYPRQRQMAPALRAFIDHVRAVASVQAEP